MTLYIVQRLGWAALVLVGISTAIFVLTRLLPGDPALIALGDQARPELVEQFRKTHGLDDPIPVQYARWLGDVMHGDFGNSLVSGRPASERLLTGLKVTIPLAVLSMFMSVAVGTLGGILAGTARESRRDYVVSLVSFLGISIPHFFLGLLLLLAFAVNLRWFPVLGLSSVDVLQDPIGGLRYLFLPAVAVGLVNAASISRMVRSNLLEVMHQKYVLVARAKGLYWPLIVLKHALRNALIPSITLIGVQFGELLGGLVITEQVFTISGIGLYLVQAVSQRDYPVIQVIVMFFAITFALVNLATDLVYGFVDPRVRLHG